MQHVRIGIDVGGTFTDIVVLDERHGTLTMHKILTQPDDPARSVLAGLDQALEAAGHEPAAVASVLHGTTIATNALIERRGARTALITTEGFRDVLEIGRQVRPALFDWLADKPEPLVPRRWRFEVRERVRADGRVETPLDEPGAEHALRQALDAGIEALAVVFLFSFLRPEHEERVAALAARLAPGLPVSLSCRVLPEYREYERTATTVANAYLAPVVSRYVTNLEHSLAGRNLAARLHLLQSNGGLADVGAVREQPVTTVLSGPAGGVTATLSVGRLLGRPNAISMDVGGTSCDICVIAGGRAAWTVEGSVANVPLRVPMLDVHSIGAGGGSILWVDSGGALRLGPRSAGALPGPACYARGGQDATLTDAHVWLGTVRAEALADKGIAADPSLAEQALRRVGERAGLDVAATARGALRLMHHHLVEGIYAVSVARGYDPRDFTLVAFGGAGPLHACAVAEELGMREVVFPVAPGVFSALGAALADTRYDVVQSHVRRWSDLNRQTLAALFAPLEHAAVQRLTRDDAPQAVVERSLDLRYVGQSFELNVLLDDWPDVSLDAIAERFHTLHAETWGYSDPSEAIQLVNLRVTVRLPRPMPPIRLARVGEAGSTGAIRVRSLTEPGDDETWALVHRFGLAPGEHIAGPALVVDPSSTGIIPAGWQAEVDAMGNLIVTR